MGGLKKGWWQGEKPTKVSFVVQTWWRGTAYLPLWDKSLKPRRTGKNAHLLVTGENCSCGKGIEQALYT